MSISMFAGLTSRRTSPATCAASSAAATGAMIASTPDQRQRARSAQQRRDVPAGHMPHREIQHPADLADLIDRDDVRVIDRRRRLRLVQEPLPELLIGGQRRRQQLQGHPPVQPLIIGAEHYRHPARAYLAFQPVPRHL